MPRENRKRGKKHKKKAEDVPETQPEKYEEQYEEPQAGPSWIVPGPNDAQSNEEAPFGYVDAEVKAYFRTVDVQLREWQEEGHAFATGEEDTDPNEDRRLFFVAALTEMSGKEKELATDPDCSNILERMAHSMDDFARRVFMDRLTGSYEKLMKHRFASHVCQTFLEVAGDTISRECRGILPPAPESAEEGELPLMKDMVLELCEELLPNFSSLIMDPFASHPLRALLALLAPELFPPEHKASILRSKKSAKHKAHQGPMKSVFVQDRQQPSTEAGKATPSQFGQLAVRFARALRDNLDANEVRALAASSVASPVLQMLLDIEAANDMAYEADSLADRVLDGLISKLLEDEDADATYEQSDYVGTLLRDPTSSHLLEILVKRVPEKVFDSIWRTYLSGKLARLASHPVANFVMAKALERVTADQLAQACEELSGAVNKIYTSARTGVLRAMVDRAAALKEQANTVVQLVLSGADLSLDSEEGRNLIVPCLLRLLTAEDYKKAREAKERAPPQDQSAGPKGKGGYRKDQPEDPLAPKTQGAVLLQSMLHLPAPHNQVILDSIFAQSIDEQIAMAHDATSSRVFDVLLQSPAVPHKEKRKFVMNFIGHYHKVVDDRIGSRVGDNCWAFADTYLKEKIARSLIIHERTLAASFYGKFFARHLNIHLLQRNAEQWKTIQANSKIAAQPQLQSQPKPTPVSDAPAPTTETATSEKKSKKRKARPEDEIEQLFEAKLGKKVKKAELATNISSSGGTEPQAPSEKKEKEGEGKERKSRKGDGEGKDRGLTDVLSAIKAAPKDDKSRKPKKKKA